MKARRPAAVAVASYLAALGATAWVLAAQPLTGPWWVYADADATYTASALNLAAGGHTKYFDHPGLPLQEAAATGFVVWHAVDRLTGSPASLHTFAGTMMVNLDRTRPLFRGLAILIYLLGVTAAFLVAARALGHSLWGLAGALLWLAAPLVPMSIQFRPDVLLSALALVCGYLLVRGYERRDPVRLLAAGTLLGFTLMVKLHAAGIVPALVLAALLSGPFPDWRTRLRDRAKEHRRLLTAVLVGWAALCIYFNASRIPFHPSVKGVTILLALGALTCAWLAAGRLRLTRRGSRLRRLVLGDFNGALLGAFALGMLIPVTIVLDDGLRSLPWVASALLGRGINSGVSTMDDYHLLFQRPLAEALVVFALAGVSAAVGAVRREWSSLLWFAASAGAAVLALGRLGTTHYFAPAYALAIVPALVLVKRAGRLAPPAAVALVLLVVLPQLSHVPAGWGNGGAQQSEAALSHLLSPRDVALTDSSVQLPDTRYYDLVAAYVEWMPAYPFRALPVSAEWLVAAEHLQPRYYLTSSPLPDASPTYAVGDYTARVSRPERAGDYYAYRLVRGPGVDRPATAAPPAGAPLVSPP